MRNLYNVIEMYTAVTLEVITFWRHLTFTFYPECYFIEPFPFLFNFFDIRAIWCSVLSAKVPECQKIKRVALNTSKCSHLIPLGLKGLSLSFAVKIDGSVQG